MTTEQFVDELALRLEDAQKRFPDSVKLQALENAQIMLANLLNNYYLTELGVRDTNQAVSSGAVAFTALDNDVLRAGEGILTVKNYQGRHCPRQGLEHLKRDENSYLLGDTSNPKYWVFANAIRMLPTSLTAVDINYLKMPTPLMDQFALTFAGVSEETFVIDDTQNVSAANDYYNGHVIYVDAPDFDPAYKCITDYTGETRTIQFAPAYDTPPTGGAGTMYFVTGDYNLTNLAAGACILNASLHPLILDLAEAECWAMKRDLGRAFSALETAIETINKLNAKVEIPEGIGVQDSYQS